MNSTILMELTADIVSAHARHNRVGPTEVPQLIEAVYGALAATGQDLPIIEAPLEPKVAIRASVKSDAITCLECGAKKKMLKGHLAARHGLSPAEYRLRWNLPHDYPMVSPDYSATRRDLARAIGLGRKPGAKLSSGRAKTIAATDAG